MGQYFAEPFERTGENVKVEIDPSNYATKADFKEATSTGTLASETELTSLKTIVDNLYVDTLKAVPGQLSMISHVVNNDIVKKTVYDK